MKISNAPHGYQWQAGDRGNLGHTGNISDNWPFGVGSMDYQNGLPKWTTLMDCQMDYLKNCTEKKMERDFLFWLIYRDPSFCFHFMFITAALKSVVPKNKHITRMSWQKYVSHMLHFSCARGKQFSKFPLRKSVKGICEYHLYGFYHV